MTEPSPMSIPFVSLSYEDTLCLVEKTGVLEKAMYMPMLLSVHVAPAIMVSQSPERSSSMATLTATREEAHAASTTQFMPSRLKTLVTVMMRWRRRWSGSVVCVFTLDSTQRGCHPTAHHPIRESSCNDQPTAARRHVAEEAGEGVQAPLGKVSLVLVRGGLNLVLGQAHLAEDLLEDGIVEARVKLVRGLLASADAEDAANILLALLGVAGDARVVEGLLDLEQGQRLVCVRVLHLDHVETKLAGLELKVWDEAAARAVDLVLGLLVGMEVGCDVDPVGREVGDVVWSGVGCGWRVALGLKSAEVSTLSLQFASICICNMNSPRPSRMDSHDSNTFSPDGRMQEKPTTAMRSSRELSLLIVGVAVLLVVLALLLLCLASRVAAGARVVVAGVAFGALVILALVWIGLVLVLIVLVG